VYEVLHIMTEHELLPRAEPAIRQRSKSIAGLLSLSLTLTAGKDWYGMPVEDENSHIADFAAFALKSRSR
jgi:hypothetical protein